MPRQSRGPSRPAPAPQRPVAPAHPPQARQASTVAHPTQQRPATQQAPPAQQQQGSQGSGLFGQMASTAAGVAVGSSIGHAIGGFFGGGSSAPAPEQQQQQQQVDQYGSVQAQGTAQADAGVCANQVQDFRRCMDEQRGDLSICGWYLDQLKACRETARQY